MPFLGLALLFGIFQMRDAGVDAMLFLGLALLSNIFKMRDAYLNRVIDKKDTERQGRGQAASLLQ
jgi:hypothetical protein